jgi:ABC-type multidrug transport system ATPase subunit
VQELIAFEGRASTRPPLEHLDEISGIHLHGVLVRFGSLRALDGLDLEAARGEIVGLLGPNGSGKTTALRVASGLVRPREGEGSVCGFPVGSLHARERLAFVPDEPSGLDELTASELVELMRALYRKGTEAELRAASPPGSFARAWESGACSGFRSPPSTR